ncbi:hypothetical protein SKAU_G00424020 [Synaphobranchus kaupii]|uniref:CCHC-type domain-containing protein n=1 Tax=Synaphobranchus kaupii TaxID=118154 RepID=A0A9Q1E5H0_SYNKA|nr:hypothetical protein SKAU_G00424020 [Synaphobranchus kaupii]
MGDEADDVLRGLTLNAEQRQQYSSVKDGFSAFFVPKKNVIYERAKFNLRVQGPTESADSFITALYALAENSKNADCHNCGKRGHYGRVCKSEKTVSAVSEDSAVLLGVVDAGEEPWTVDVGVRHTKVAFKIDTGADVTVMPEQVYREIAQGSTRSLTPGKKALVGPGTPLTVVGVAREVLQCGDRSTTEDIYVLKHLKVALLSRPASVRLRLVARVDSIDLETVKQIYPKLCRGLGLIQQKYTIKLNPDTKPVSLKVPRRVPLPLMGKVKKELERIEQLGVISCIEEPTEWCSGMVVAPKKSGEIRICVDLSPLNNAVCREKFVLPSVDQTLGMPSDAVIFSKLDANMGFWQVPLSQECAHYTTFITPFWRYYFNRLPFGIASKTRGKESFQFGTRRSSVDHPHQDYWHSDICTSYAEIVSGQRTTGYRRNRHHLVPMPPAADSSCEAQQAPTTRWRWMIATPQGGGG